jgi:hypothetical protein
MHVQERRHQRRLTIKLPARIQAREADGTSWEEIASCEDVSLSGLRLQLAHAVQRGQVLRITLPLPPSFRQYDITDSSYRVYVLARHARPLPNGATAVGAVFLGRHPPRGTEGLTNELFLFKGDAATTGPAGSTRTTFLLRLDAEQAPGGLAREERAQAEQLAQRGAIVKATTLPVAKGALLSVSEIGGDFTGRAEVRTITIGPDGQPRLHLFFLDGPLPERLVPPPQPPDAG